MFQNRSQAILLTIVLFFISSIGMAQKNKKSNEEFTTGEIFICDFEPQTDPSIPNYLRVKASRHTDVVLRLIDKKTDKCIRYAFISHGDKYDIKGIPDGIYYVKVGLGSEWTFQDTSKCIGDFKENSIYKKYNHTLDYRVKGTKKNPQYPMYELDFDLKITKGKEMPEEEITAKEFRK